MSTLLLSEYVCYLVQQNTVLLIRGIFVLDNFCGKEFL